MKSIVYLLFTYDYEGSVEHCASRSLDRIKSYIEKVEEDDVTVVIGEPQEFLGETVYEVKIGDEVSEYFIREVEFV